MKELLPHASFMDTSHREFIWSELVSFVLKPRSLFIFFSSTSIRDTHHDLPIDWEKQHFPELRDLKVICF